MMKKFPTLLVALASTAAFGAELNTLGDLKVVATPTGAQVVVSGSRAPTFTVFRLPDPDRLVVDLSSADASAVKGPHAGAGPVSGIVASQFSDEHASVGRLLLALDRASQYDVRADGNRVVISVEGAGAQTTDTAGKPMEVEAAAVKPEPVKVEPVKVEPVKVEEKIEVAKAEPVKEEAKAEPAKTESPKVEVAKAEEAKPAVAEKSEPSPQPSPEGRGGVGAKAVIAANDPAASEPNVVASQMDEQAVKKPARKITALVYVKDALRIATDGQIAKYELIELSSPPRLALDVYGVALATKPPKTAGKVKSIRAGAHEGRVRLVLDMTGDMPAYRATRTPNGVMVSLAAMPKPAAPAPAVAKAEPAARPEPAKAAAEEDGKVEVEIDGQPVAIEQETALAAKAEAPAPAPVATAKPLPAVDVKDLTFEDEPSGGKIDLKLSGEAHWKVDRPDDKSAVLTLDQARLPKRLERSLDTSALDTPVKMISAFAVPGAAERVRVVVAGSGALEETVVKTPTGLAWRLSVKGVKTEEAAVASKTAGFTSEAPRYAEEGAPKRRGYVGKKVSFEFKDIDIHNLLRIIAEVSKKNIVVADDVQGKVTIRLRNVPWDQALELILRSKGLGQEDLGNIIRVAPLRTLEEEAKLREERKKSLTRQAELEVRLIPVNYATATVMADRVKDVLSDRGTVSVDGRTNTLIVRDVRTSIEKAQQLVRTLDTQTPQVLIESRIVEANTTFSRQVGVQWGGQAQAAPGTGNPTGLAFPNFVAVRGGSVPDGNQGTADIPNFAVNLPAAVGQGSGGALGFVFGSAGGALALNLRISALENEGQVKTISSPKVTTLDNAAAKISQGVSVPFSQVSAAGVNTTFIEARLSLDVTPHITQDGSVLMTIRAENNQPDPSSTGANGQPSIQRKEASTQVLVKDGDTTVIGGIYVRRAAQSSARVPLLGSIPVLGYFFRTTNESDNRQELLIFITPRILNRQTIASNL